MKLFFISMMLLILAMFIIPIGGMCESNINHEYYMYGFMFAEILCVTTLIRVFIKIRKNESI
jgi:hypothetical protein